MHIVKLAGLALGAILVSTPAVALTTITVSAGETCQLAARGDFKCIWVADDGTTSSAEGNLQLYPGMLGTFTFKRGSKFAASGKISTSLSYDDPADYHLKNVPIFYGSNAYASMTNDPNFPLTGEMTFRTVLSSVVNIDNGEASARELIIRPERTAGALVIFNYFQINDRFCCEFVGSGVWTASVEWSLSRDSEIYLAFANTSVNGIPEPASWAMMILGFGAIGYRLRRRPAPALARA